MTTWKRIEIKTSYEVAVKIFGVDKFMRFQIVMGVHNVVIDITVWEGSVELLNCLSDNLLVNITRSPMFLCTVKLLKFFCIIGSVINLVVWAYVIYVDLAPILHQTNKISILEHITKFVASILASEQVQEKCIPLMISKLISSTLFSRGIHVIYEGNSATR